jgi:hypothetical protein
MKKNLIAALLKKRNQYLLQFMVIIIFMFIFNIMKKLNSTNLLSFFFFDVDSFCWLGRVIIGVVIVYGVYAYIVMPDPITDHPSLTDRLNVLEKEIDFQVIPLENSTFWDSFITVFPIYSFLVVLLLWIIFYIIKIKSA